MSPNRKAAAKDAVEKFYGLGKYDDGREPGDISDRVPRVPMNVVKGDYVFADWIRREFGKSAAELRKELGL